MIERFSRISKIECEWLIEFISNRFDYDFYYTSNNARIYVNDIISLKNFLKNSREVYIKKERGDYVGIIMAWKSVGGGKERYYVKVNAKNSKVAKELLTVLLWNVKKDLFVKIRKDNSFLSTFKQKGFRFAGGRGIQILLKRKFDKN